MNYKKLSSIIEINPYRPLSKNSIASFVSMDNIVVNQRKIQKYSKRKVSGSKTTFKNGDTLLAKITPSLENGKTVFVDILQKNEIGHGSTEFYVLTGKSNITLNLFVYYLMRMPEFREKAIQSMTGSSGRQRVQKTVFDDFKINLPDISTQNRIIRVLDSIDEQIKSLQNQNRILKQMIYATFKSQFVDFDGITEFENSELGKIPKGWSVDILSNNVEIKKGRKPKDILNYKKEGYLPQILLEMFNTGKYSYANTANMIFSEKTDTLMVMDGISSGRSEIGYVGVVGSTIAKISFKRNPYFFHYVIKNLEPIIKSNLTGSAIPHVDKNFLNCTMLTIPTSNILNDFEKFVLNLHEQIDNNKKQVYVLIKMRYILLPKLISGEIRV